MDWQEISLSVPFEFVEPVSYLFSRYGRGLSTELEGPDRVLLKTYLPNTSRQRLARIDVGVRLVSSIQSVGELNVRQLPEDADWREIWKTHFNLLRVGQRIVIQPSWIEYHASPGEVVIKLDPGMAFGTGYHPTTSTCLEALEELTQPGMDVLDLGTGSAILAIAAIKLGAGKVAAMDIDPDAVKAARQNLRRTRLTRHVTLTLGSLPHPVAGPGQFDLCVANISARAVCERAPHIAPTLRPNGILIASGTTADQDKEVQDVVIPLGFSLVRKWEQEDWVTQAFQKPA